MYPDRIAFDALVKRQLHMLFICNVETVFRECHGKRERIKVCCGLNLYVDPKLCCPIRIKHGHRKLALAVNAQKIAFGKRNLYPGIAGRGLTHVLHGEHKVERLVPLDDPVTVTGSCFALSGIINNRKAPFQVRPLDACRVNGQMPGRGVVVVCLVEPERNRYFSFFRR